MSNLSGQLFDLYRSEIFPVLANNDPEYQRSLAAAGLGWKVTTVPEEHRASFEEEMKMRAWMGARRVEEAKSLEPGSIRVKVLTGATTLYRVTQKGTQTPPGIWWFSSKLAAECRKEAGSDPARQLEWLRNVLAVCFNWSKFDQVQRFALHGGERIPVVIGTGLPMPYYKADPYVDRKTGQTMISLPADYWKRMGQKLLGGELQIVLPWIPVSRVTFADRL